MSRSVLAFLAGIHRLETAQRSGPSAFAESWTFPRYMDPPMPIRIEA